MPRSSRTARSPAQENHSAVPTSHVPRPRPAPPRPHIQARRRRTRRRPGIAEDARTSTATQRDEAYPWPESSSSAVTSRRGEAAVPASPPPSSGSRPRRSRACKHGEQRSGPTQRTSGSSRSPSSASPGPGAAGSVPHSTSESGGGGRGQSGAASEPLPSGRQRGRGAGTYRAGGRRGPAGRRREDAARPCGPAAPAAPSHLRADHGVAGSPAPARRQQQQQQQPRGAPGGAGAPHGPGPTAPLPAHGPRRRHHRRLPLPALLPGSRDRPGVGPAPLCPALPRTDPARRAVAVPWSGRARFAPRGRGVAALPGPALG